MKRTVLITREIPRRTTYGHLVYMYEIVKFLKDNQHHVTILLTTSTLPFYQKTDMPSSSTKIIGSKILSLGNHCIAYGALWSRATRKLGLSQFPSPECDEILGAFPSGADIRYCSNKINSIKPDFILVDTIFLTPIVQHLDVAARTFLITHDVVHRRWQSLTARGYRLSPATFDQETEARLLNQFDVIIAIQPEEAALFKHLAPSRDVITVSMPVAEAAKKPTSERSQHHCIFVGSDGLVNADGLRWFAKEVWPLVTASVPDAELHVYGRVCSMVDLASTAGIIMHGFTEDLTEAYSRSRVAIAPLKAGSGLKVKILEYLSFGLPCVTTSIGAAGFVYGEDTPFALADDEDSFARHVVELLVDDERRRRMEGRALAYCQLYSREGVFRELGERLT